MDYQNVFYLSVALYLCMEAKGDLKFDCINVKSNNFCCTVNGLLLMMFPCKHAKQNFINRSVHCSGESLIKELKRFSKVN